MGKNSAIPAVVDLAVLSFELNAESPKSNHVSGSWQSPGEAYINRSSTLQNCHFNAFFAATHGLRRILHHSVDVEDLMQLIHGGLRYMAAGKLWLRVFHALKAECCVRRVAKRLGTKARHQHLVRMRQWLTAWTAADTDVHTAAREKVQQATSLHGGPLPSQLTAAARTALPITTTLRTQVIWEVYWLLYAQHKLKLMRHWTQWMKLRARRAALRRSKGDGQLDMATGAGHDFWEGEPRSLAAIDAALFVGVLQEPRFHVFGRSLHAKELRRLAEANLFPICDPRLPRALQRAPPTLLAFLTSPLCTEPDWFLERFQQPRPIIPPFQPKQFVDRRSNSVPQVENPDGALLYRVSHPGALRRNTLQDSRLLKRGSLPFAVLPVAPVRRTSLAPLPTGLSAERRGSIPVPVERRGSIAMSVERRGSIPTSVNRRGSIPLQVPWLASAAFPIDASPGAVEVPPPEEGKPVHPSRRERAASLPRLDDRLLSQIQKATHS
eukprot:GGOE01026540.1.p1 GENE.GGOE01026540.1~~GGOE01026540.1.p1  ORF type:complete len:509 (-),score=96.97 GGOE01026540.1:703-2187(-)